MRSDAAKDPNQPSSGLKNVSLKMLGVLNLPS
jgi:hypothetical protein